MSALNRGHQDPTSDDRQARVAALIRGLWPHRMSTEAARQIEALYQDEIGAPSIDAAHLFRQRTWSESTFGPGVRLGVLDHIRKELEEVAEDPTCLEEWVDVVILGLDGAWRAGHEPEAIIAAIKAKQAANERRTWPDWRTVGSDQAIEHVRDEAPQ